MSYLRALARILAALLVALVSLEIGLSSTVLGTPCVETCEDDGPDGQCAPGCEDCLCCAHSRVTVAPPAGSAAPIATSVALVWREDARPPTPEPHEILRVPKLA